MDLLINYSKTVTEKVKKKYSKLLTTKCETGTSDASISNGPAQPCGPLGTEPRASFKSQSVNCGWRVRPSEGKDRVVRGEGRRGRGGQGGGGLPGEIGRAHV